MIWPATWLAALAGLVLASIPGALLGALLGQVLDRRLALRSWGELYRRLGGTPALSGEELLFVALGRLAKADGRVQEQHIQQAREEMRRLELQADAQRAAIDAFARGKAGQDDLRRPLRRLRHQPDQARQLLQACVRMRRPTGDWVAQSSVCWRPGVTGWAFRAASWMACWPVAGAARRRRPSVRPMSRPCSCSVWIVRRMPARSSAPIAAS